MADRTNSLPDPRTIATAVGAMRAGAGAVLLLAPFLAAGRDATGRLLTRVIGVRDLVLGGGTIWAASRDETTRSAWVRAGAVSDTADTVIMLRSGRSIGRFKAIGAAALSAPFVAAAAAHELSTRAQRAQHEVARHPNP